MNPHRCCFWGEGVPNHKVRACFYRSHSPSKCKMKICITCFLQSKPNPHQVDHLLSPTPTYFFSIYSETRDNERVNEEVTEGPLVTLRCRALPHTYKQCTTVRPSPPLYSSCHLSTWRMSFKKERLDTGVSLYIGQPRNWNCCTIRYPSWGWTVRQWSGSEKKTGIIYFIEFPRADPTYSIFSSKQGNIKGEACLSITKEASTGWRVMSFNTELL